MGPIEIPEQLRGLAQCLDGWDYEVSDWSRLPSEPLVTVSLVTYKHAPFIRQALESVLIQQTSFPYEVCVGDDGSDDGTREICFEYAAEYPERVRLFLRDRENPARRKYCVPYRHNGTELRKASRAKYVAMIDGDDYWTSPVKLRRQVEFLEAQDDCTICFHCAQWFDQNSGKMVDHVYGPPVPKPFYTLDDLLEYGNFMPTCSVMFRNEVFGGYPEWYCATQFGDFPLHVLNASHGKVGFIADILSVYRYHAGGAYTCEDVTQRVEKLLETYSLLAENLPIGARKSYRKGVGALQLELSDAYAVAHKTTKAMKAGLTALKTLPLALKPRAVRKVARLIPGLRRVVNVVRKGCGGF